MQTCYKILFPLLVLFIFNACGGDRWDPDVSQVQADVELVRLDKAFAETDSNNADKTLDTLFEKYPDMMQALIESILEIGPANDPRSIAIFKKNYLFDKGKDTLFRDVLKYYPPERTEALRRDFEEAFRHYRYYFPQARVPVVYTLATTKSLAAFTLEDKALGVGLDMFMGKDYRFYQVELFYEYMVKYFSAEYILPRSFKSVFQGKYEQAEQFREQNLLNNMIYMGKSMFFLHAMLPATPDSVILEYTDKQLDWCQDNEVMIWNHLVNDVSLYNTDQKRVDRYIQPAPYTIDEGVPAGSAPRLGEWVGWQIVKAYMEERPEVTLEQLCKETDYKKILRESRYRPK